MAAVLIIGASRGIGLEGPWGSVKQRSPETALLFGQRPWRSNQDAIAKR
jgi:hypothetical protein